MLFERSIPVPMEDDLVHTDTDPFCSDPTCPCKEDAEAIDAVASMVEHGLMTPEEATQFVSGKLV